MLICRRMDGLVDMAHKKRLQNEMQNGTRLILERFFSPFVLVSFVPYSIVNEGLFQGAPFWHHLPNLKYNTISLSWFNGFWIIIDSHRIIHTVSPTDLTSKIPPTDVWWIGTLIHTHA